MANMAYTRIIAIGNNQSIQNYSNKIRLFKDEQLIDTNRMFPQLAHFTDKFIKESEINREEIKKWRYENWGTDTGIAIHRLISDTRLNKFSLHIMDIDTKYCAPFGFVNSLSNKHKNLNFLIDIELEPSYALLEYIDNSNNQALTIFEIADFFDNDFFENLKPNYLNNFDDLETTPEIHAALDYTRTGKTYLKLKFPNGIPFSLL